MIIMIKMFILEKFENAFWLAWDFWHVLTVVFVYKFLKCWQSWIFVLNTIANISKRPYGLDKYFASAHWMYELDEEERLWFGESWTFFFI